MKLKFIKHPLWNYAHPDDPSPVNGAKCMQCVIAENPHGQHFLLWLSNGVHWSLSRNDPHYGKVELGEIELEGI